MPERETTMRNRSENRHKEKDGRSDEHRYSHHEMGSYKTGTHHHEHHRSKKD